MHSKTKKIVNKPFKYSLTSSVTLYFNKQPKLKTYFKNRKQIYNPQTVKTLLNANISQYKLQKCKYTFTGKCTSKLAHVLKI